MMEAKIGPRGCLSIKRGPNWREQFCPFAQGDCACGGWCPLFHEPQYFETYVSIILCHQTIYVDKDSFVDERTKDKGENDA